MKRLLFYCQHRLGFDHLVRALNLGNGLAANFQVCLINGGEVIQGYSLPNTVEVVNIVPLKTTPDCSALQDSSGFETIEAALAFRRDRLLEICDRVQPDVLIVDGFPFAQHQFAPELLPLIERARRYGASVMCSLSDIVVTPQEPPQDDTVCTLLNRYFDAVLVHSDPDIIALDRSFSRLGAVNCPIQYTGYIAQGVERWSPAMANTPEILSPSTSPPLIVVSGSNEPMSHRLLHCVAHARTHLADRIPYHIHLCPHTSTPDTVMEPLRAMAQHQPRLSIQPSSTHRWPTLGQAALVITVAGYTAVANILATGVRSLLLPITDGLESHDPAQTIRAQRLDALGLASVLQPEDLEPERLAQRIGKVLERSPSSLVVDANPVHPIPADVDGVRHTTDILTALCHHPILKPTLH